MDCTCPSARNVVNLITCISCALVGVEVLNLAGNLSPLWRIEILAWSHVATKVDHKFDV